MYFSNKRQRFLINQGYSFKVSECQMNPAISRGLILGSVKLAIVAVSPYKTAAFNCYFRIFFVKLYDNDNNNNNNNNSYDDDDNNNNIKNIIIIIIIVLLI